MSNCALFIQNVILKNVLTHILLCTHLPPTFLYILLSILSLPFSPPSSHDPPLLPDPILDSRRMQSLEILVQKLRTEVLDLSNKLAAG